MAFDLLKFSRPRPHDERRQRGRRVDRLGRGHGFLSHPHPVSKEYHCPRHPFGCRVLHAPGQPRPALVHAQGQAQRIHPHLRHRTAHHQLMVGDRVVKQDLSREIAIFASKIGRKLKR